MNANNDLMDISEINNQELNMSNSLEAENLNNFKNKMA